MNYSETIIIGAGAAGLFCAVQLGKLGRQVAVLDNGKKIGRKILMSGGGSLPFAKSAFCKICPRPLYQPGFYFLGGEIRHRLPRKRTRTIIL